MEEDKPQILLWTAPECHFRVTLPVPVLNGIRILAVEAFYSVPRGGVEIGGVLFGIREPAAIHIQAHRPIRCRYATGPSFTLSVDDQLGLSGLLENAPADPDLAGMMPLGWYHSHTRSELLLSAADLQLYSDFFPERWQIALVLRPANLQPTKACIFFRDRLGAVKSSAAAREFKLEPPAFGLTLLSPLDAAVSQVAPVVVPAAVVAEPLPVPPAVAVAAAMAANGSVAIVAEPPDTVSPEVAPEPAPEPVPESASEYDEKLPEPGLPGFPVAETPAAKKLRVGWKWALITLVLLTVIGGAAFLKWGRVAKSEGLGLETYDINGAFLIRWDRESSIILAAGNAMLEIEDGGEKLILELSPAELEVGGYGYMRRTGQVSVRMKVGGPPPVEEYSNFKGVQALGSQSAQSTDASNTLPRLLEEKEHLKTELINESMQSSELRRENTSLRKQLAEERDKSTATPER